MKIQQITTPYYKRALPILSTQNQSDIPAYNQKQSVSISSINPINYLAYNNVSFKSQTHIKNSTLMNYGYETATVDANGYLTNKGKNIILRNAKDLIALSKTEKAWNKNFALAADIDLENNLFKGIGNVRKSYSGEFNGNGYTIKNLNMNIEGFSSVGLFRMCNNATIKNLSVKDASITGKNDVGGIVGYCENDTKLENLEFSGDVKANNSAGGIVGYLNNSSCINSAFTGTISPNSKRQEDDSRFIFISNKSNNESNSQKMYGGIAGLAENSEIKGTMVNAEIENSDTAGGICGMANWVEISDNTFSGKITSDANWGNLIGILQHSTLGNSYCLDKKPLVGKSEDSKIINCFSSTAMLNKDFYHKWDSSIWNISKGKLPRQHKYIEQTNPANIFVEDVNNDIKNNNIKFITDFVAPNHITIKLEDMEPPKHYEDNEPELEKIRNCKSSSELAAKFAYWTDSFRPFFNPEDKKVDEILLELVKNKNFNMNKRWNDIPLQAEIRSVFDEFEAATYCTPLYVLSCLNKGYIFNEALKRNDIDPFVMNGPPYERIGIFEGLYDAPIATNTFLLFKSENPIVKKYMEKMTKKLPFWKSPDRLTNLLCKNPIDKFQYDENTHEVKIPKYLIPELNDFNGINVDLDVKTSNFWEILNSPDIPATYQDSLGNTVLHIIAKGNFSQSEEKTYLDIAMNNDGNLEIRNKDNQTPYEIALESKKDNLFLQMINEKIQNKYCLDKEGNNVLLMSVKYNHSKQAPMILTQLHDLGFSLNVCDKEQSTPLIEAVKNNDLAKINYMITNGAAVDLCDENGQTALHHAFINKNIQVIKWFMDSYACLEVKDKMGMTPKDYWPDCDANPDFAKLNWNAAVGMYRVSSISDVEAQSLNMTDINSLSKELNDVDSFNPYELDAKGSALEKSLIRLYASLCVNTYNSNKYTDRIMYRKEITEQILEKLVQTNNPYAKECLVKILKDKSIDINKTNSDNDTLLSLSLKSYKKAISNKEKLACMQIIKCLLDNGAKVDIPDESGQTALYHAVYTDNVIIFNEVLGKHPNVNHTDILGKNPIQYITKDEKNPIYKAYCIYAKNRALN